MKGFDGGGFAVGEVYGARWWSVRAHGADLALRGAYGGDWTAGDNTAKCRGYQHRVPNENCGCGFWAYWQPEEAPIAAKPRVLGVVKGWGDDTLIGDKGFRCGRARIVALCCEGIAKRRVYDTKPTYVAGPPEGVRMRDPDGFMKMFKALGGEGTYREAPASPREEDDYLAQAEIEYWLGERYRCPVYTTFDGMLAMHPTTKDYLPADPDSLPPWHEELSRMAMMDPASYQRTAKLLAETMAEFADLGKATLSAGAALRKLIDVADLTDTSYPIDTMAQWGASTWTGLLGPD